MYTTIEQGVAALVAAGHPESVARAAMLEYCGGEIEGLLHDPEGNAVEHNFEQVRGAYEAFIEDAEVTDEGIVFDGELAFDTNGYWLRKG